MLGIGVLLLPRPALAQGPPADVGQVMKAVALATGLAGVPAHVQVKPIDPELAADPAALRPLDAFVVRETDGTLRQVIYLNARSEMVRMAADEPAPYAHLLAAVIHHELQHLAGATEADARRAEAAFVRACVDRGTLPRSWAGRYVELLAHHREGTTRPR